jgi:hypothetical protein
MTYSQNWLQSGMAPVFRTSQLMFHVDETGCVLNSRQSLKVVAETGSKMFLKPNVSLKRENGYYCSVLQC